MKILKNNLDERQEQELLHIEHVGCWLAFWALFAALVVQNVLGDFSFREVGGELCVLLLLCGYLMVACIRRGIWDRRLRADGRTNLLASMIGALTSGLVLFARHLYQGHISPGKAAAIGLFNAGFMFVLCFAGLTISAALYRRRRRKLEGEPEEKTE